MWLGGSLGFRGLVRADAGCVPRDVSQAPPHRPHVRSSEDRLFGSLRVVHRVAHDNGLPTAALAQVLESGAGAGEQPMERMRPKLCEGRGCGMRIRRRWCVGGMWIAQETLYSTRLSPVSQ